MFVKRLSMRCDENVPKLLPMLKKEEITSPPSHPPALGIFSTRLALLVIVRIQSDGCQIIRRAALFASQSMKSLKCAPVIAQLILCDVFYMALLSHSLL